MLAAGTVRPSCARAAMHAAALGGTPPRRGWALADARFAVAVRLFTFTRRTHTSFASVAVDPSVCRGRTAIGDPSASGRTYPGRPTRQMLGSDVLVNP